MQNTLFRLGAIALFSSLAVAQQLGVPASLANAEGSSSGNIWRNGTNRVQAIYDSTHFQAQGADAPIVINTLEWRAVGGATGTAGSYPSVDLYLSTAATDYAAISTTYATNRGADHTLVYSGAVNFAVAAGTTPNSWYINVPLTTPFTYDPSSGSDLLVEIVINAAPTITPATLSTSNVVATHRANTVRSVGSTTALTGSASAFAPVVRISYTEPAGVAKRIAYGNGCVDQKVSFFEQFAPGTFDLAGTTSTSNSVQLLPNAQGGYTVAAGGSSWFTPVAPDLLLGDDAVSAAQPLPFTFSYPGGSTMAIVVGSNGHVWLGAAGATSATGTGATFIAAGARLSPYWTDLDPSAATGGGSVHFDVAPGNTAVYVTWLNVPMWEATPSTPRFLNNVQLAIDSSGAVEFRYLDCSAPTYAIVTGFTPGGARLPAATDISASMPFSTLAELSPLQLAASARPVQGHSIDMVTSAIPATATLGSLMLNFGGAQAGVGLAAMGMPGCDLNVSPFFAFGITFVANAATVAIPVAIPANPAFTGASVQFQSVVLVPGVNAFGAVTSNGVQLLLGTL